MNFSGIKWLDTANGPGTRISLFVSGCPHHCPACFNKDAWDYNFGRPFTTEIEDSIVAELRRPDIDGLSILGGEPFAPRNQVSMYLFLRRLRNELPNINVWIYSGYTAEQLLHKIITPISYGLAELCDVLVDGPFIQKLRDIKLLYRGSSNQRLVDIRASIASESIVQWNQA